MSLIDRVKRRLPIFGAPPPSPAPPAARRPPAPVEEEEAPAVSPRGGKPVREFIEETVKAHPIVLFMKGTAVQPQCGFSATAAGILHGYGKGLHTVDVLSDPDIREGVKAYTSWPTIPQVFIGGEFVGGADILRQIHDQGELKGMIDKATG